MNPYRRAWLFWAAGTFGGFCAIETIALRQRRVDDTLSAVTRDVLGLYPQRGYRPITQLAFPVGVVGFVGWYLPHIFRIPTGSFDSLAPSVDRVVITTIPRRTRSARTTLSWNARRGSRPRP